ncbi:hypothetical protein J1N35_002425 [Gossypium stocksii]|uniref:Uncharacterized protein n=1 Tax=Gossypium stocksii TaxID=47602 RepID=A0A9D3WKX6_9ROSI|nr:hypothetical protein J1N35_002425 [Gossypium stocksii]
MTSPQLLSQIENQEILRPSPHLRPNIYRDNSTDVCDFHHDKRHTTNDCIHLRDGIESTIHREKLPRFVVRQWKPYGHRNKDNSAFSSQGLDKGKGK